MDTLFMDILLTKSRKIPYAPFTFSFTHAKCYAEHAYFAIGYPTERLFEPLLSWIGVLIKVYCADED